MDPKITIVFIADAVSKRTIDMINKYLHGGIKLLKTQGVNYNQVNHVNANCSSAQGHAGIFTGTYAKYHGMVNDVWLDANGNLYTAEQDNDLNTAGVYDPTKPNTIYTEPSFYYQAGVSPRNYRADTVADQLILNSNQNHETQVFSISQDPLTSTMMAGQMGKAIWLDGISGLFTTSRYYYPNGIPDFVLQFNQENPVPPTVTWMPVYPQGSPPYDFPDAQNYEYSVVLSPPFFPVEVYPPNQTLFNKTLNSIVPIFGAGLYNVTPVGIKKVFDLAKRTIDLHFCNKSNQRLVLFLNIASFDVLGNFLGPQTQEALDIVYHIDLQLQHLMCFLLKFISPKEALFLLTADEGYYPSIPELLFRRGFGLARRLVATNNGLPSPPFPTDLITAYNQQLATIYGSALIQQIIPPFVYLDLLNFNKLPSETQILVLETIKVLLRATPGIRDAWTFQELEEKALVQEDPTHYWKLYLFKNVPPLSAPNLTPPPPPLPFLPQPQERRSGEIVFQTFPYSVMMYALDVQPIHGVDHTSSYNYDSQVPLYVYQKGRFDHKIINKPIITQQIGPTLSFLLKVPYPSATAPNLKLLPGLGKKGRC